MEVGTELLGQTTRVALAVLAGIGMLLAAFALLRRALRTSNTVAGCCGATLPVGSGNQAGSLRPQAESHVPSAACSRVEHEGAGHVQDVSRVEAHAGHRA